MPDEVQIKGQADPVTMLKIYKGMIIALSGAVGILVLLIVWGLGVDRAMLAAFLVWILPTIVNSAHQFMKGVDPADLSTDQQ